MRRPPLIRQGAGPLEAYAAAHAQQAETEQKVARIVQAVGADAPPSNRTYDLGDVDLLRGIPAANGTGRPGGLGGAIRGTRP